MRRLKIRNEKYRVYGTLTVTVEIFVEMPDNKEYSEEEVFAKAQEVFKGIDNYAGNGGADKLIGVVNDDDSIQADDEVTFTYCKPMEDE